MPLGILAGCQRWRQVVHQLVVALKHVGNLLGESGVQVQARHFVLVLVRHQFEQITRDRLGQLGAAAQLPLGSLHFFHKSPVLRCISRILVIRQKRFALRDQFRHPWLFHKLDHLRRAVDGLHLRPVVRAATAPFKRGLVVGDLHAVELHGAQQGSARQRNTSFLPGIAQHQRVGVDAVAQQLHGHLIGIKHAHMLGAAHRLCQRRAALRSR